ncbi:MOB kinase activator-like 4 [Echria macrotheca]|uniref:MOB kinase activator-like 4 n=1 Tax=Echria macrotheca TaxID=438768 RepID=A0AAJ0FFU5_9PEZI|nr:MOB kinase activator-like 4 [Echria macrotheca]
MPSSPRLPSPPPPAEIQIGPKSPLMGPNATRQAQQMEQTAIDANAKRRIHPGTRSADMAAGPPLVPLHELDSAFQLQEHLAALHFHHTESNTIAITRDTARTLATPPLGIDKTLWLYELCRFLVGQCNSLIVGFLFDSPPCSAATCPEMRASEWQFLCAVHDSPKSCCAIDYCCHTLDWAANVVTNPKIFPSRFVVDAHDRQTALKNLINVFRRLHRIFAHAWFQHRGVFWSVEGMTGLYVFFKTVCDVYDLLPAENYKLPPEAEGLEPATGIEAEAPERKVLLQHHQQQQPAQPAAPSAGAPRLSAPRGTADQGLGEDDNLGPMSRTNTRRHIKSSPSTGSAVTTVPEADEDDATDVTNRLRGMHISSTAAAAAVADEEMELATIPVIVEHLPVDQPPARPGSVVPFPASRSTATTPAFDVAPIPEVESPAAEPDVVEIEPPPQNEPVSTSGTEPAAEVGAFEAQAAEDVETASPSSAPEPTVEVKEVDPESAPEPFEPASEPEIHMHPEPEVSKSAEHTNGSAEPAAVEKEEPVQEKAEAHADSEMAIEEETPSESSGAGISTPPLSEGDAVPEDAGVKGEEDTAAAPAAKDTTEPTEEGKKDIVEDKPELAPAAAAETVPAEEGKKEEDTKAE